MSFSSTSIEDHSLLENNSFLTIPTLKNEKTEEDSKNFISWLDEKWFLIFLFLIALIPRCWALDAPYMIDEPYYVLVADNILESPFNPLGPTGAQTLPEPPLFSYLLASWWTLFGRSNVSSHLFTAILGSLSIVITYFLGKKFYGRKVALLSSCLLIFSPVHWTLSRLAMTDILFFILFLCSIYFLFEGVERNDTTRLAVGGISVGLTFLTKPHGLVIIFIILTYITLSHKGRDLFDKKVLVCLTVIPVLTISPWLFWCYHQRDYFANLMQLYSVLLFESSSLSGLRYFPFEPVYVIFESLSLHLLLCAIPLMTLPYIIILRKITASLGMKLLVFASTYSFAVLIISLIIPGDVQIRGAKLLGYLSPILGPTLTKFIKILLISIGTFSVGGLVLEIYRHIESKENKMILSWVVTLLCMFSILTLKYPRFLLPVLPPFHYTIGKLLVPFSEGSNSARLIFVLMLSLCLIGYVVVGYDTNSYLITGTRVISQKLIEWIEYTRFSDT